MFTSTSDCWIVVCDPWAFLRFRSPDRPHLPFHLPEGLRFFLVLVHRARAAFLASSLRCSDVSAAMRFFPPLPPAAFPPFLPISRMTSEIRSRLILSSYEECVLLATFGVLTICNLVCNTQCQLR